MRFYSIFILMFSMLMLESHAQLWTQSFEMNGLGTQYFSPVVFSNNSNAHFNRTLPASISNAAAPYTSFQGNYIWAGENLDDISAGGDGLDSKLITFAPINIVGQTNLEFRGLFGTGNPMAGWDFTDAFYLEYQIDLGPWIKLLQFSTPGVSGNTGLYQDLNFDGIGEGLALSSQLHQFTASIASTGTTLNLRVFSLANGSGEEFAFDFLRLYNTSSAIPGCTNPMATNFNSTAILDDASCQFPGCTDPVALNFDPLANVDNATCIGAVPLVVINEIHYNPSSYAGFADVDYEFIELYNPTSSSINLSGWRISQAVDFTFPAASSIGPGSYVLVASNPLIYTGIGVPVFQYVGSLSNSGDLINLVENHNIMVDHVEYFPNPSWPTGADSNGPSLELINYLMPNSDPLSWCSGVVNNGSPGQTNSCYALIEGCMNPLASNYNVNAQIDNGTCIVVGCTYNSALNFNPTANSDDGSCLYSSESPCPSDINNDGVVNTSDLLLFMAAFGQFCP